MRRIVLKTQLGGKDLTYSGRFIGFIKDDEFNALVQKHSEVANKLETKGTLPLVDVCRKKDNLTGHRLVLSLRKAGDKDVLDKRLFVSDRLDYIAQVTDDEVVIMCDGGESSLIMKEEKE